MSQVQVVRSMFDNNTVWAKHKARVQNSPFLGPLSKQRALICGWPGSGKSTLLRSIPRCIIADCERSGEGLIVPRPDLTGVWPCRRWEDLDELVSVLEEDAKTNGENRLYECVGIDTYDGLGGNQNSLAAEYIMRDSKADVVAAFGANGSGWARLAELPARILIRLEAAGYGWFVTTHLRRKFDGSVTRITRDLTARVDAFAANRALMICELTKSVTMVQTKKSFTLPNGTLVETDGELAQRAVYRVAFSSTSDGKEELCKARVIRSGDAFEFGVEDGWDKWNALWETRRAELLETIKNAGSVSPTATQAAKAA